MSISQYIGNLCREFWQASTSGLPKNLAEPSSLEVGEVVIDSVSKRFRKRNAKRTSYSTVKSGLINASSASESVASQKQTGNDSNFFYALDAASFHVKPGCALGVIGRNGSGKSTLLKLISGIYLPDGGSVQKNGRISALIELGAGFHPDFSGRENIYLGGVMYGLSRKEIDERFDAIVAYSELEDCIDDPVRTYSSGMYMRLGFSLAIHTDPDILLVDEVLAVGDAAFIAKCHDSISEMKRRGKTLIFVTHDLPSIERWCDEVVWLANGVVKQRGEPRKVIDSYLAEVEQGQREKLEEENERRSSLEEKESGESGERWGSKDVEIYDVIMLDQSNEPSWLVDQEEAVRVQFRYRINSIVSDLVFGVGIVRADGLHVHGTNTDIENLEIEVPQDESQYPIEGVVNYSIDRIGLVDGTYFLDVAAHREDGFSFDYHHLKHKFSVRSTNKAVGVFCPKHSWSIETTSSEETIGRRVA
ncbi:UNVERIFIED_CONTAM: hypothetical protein GTU68_052808 [Idotea baltica]|nr:hypothetical protein [Idotea baltica]